MLTIKYEDTFFTVEHNQTGEKITVYADDPQFIHFMNSARCHVDNLSVLRNGSRADRIRVIRDLYGLNIRQANELLENLVYYNKN